MHLPDQIQAIWRRFDKGWVPGAVLSAAVFCLICFDYSRDGQLDADAFLRGAVVSGLLFFVFTGVIGSLVHDTIVELRQYGSRDEHEPDDWVVLCVFVAIKTLVRCTVGVVLVLVWLGGVVMIMETSADIGFAGPALLALFYSALLFWMSCKFVILMDRIRFPSNSDE